MHKKPNFFIIGAPKCGTTSLAAWLAEHPQVYMCKPKEPAFFNHDHRKIKNESPAVYERYFYDVRSEHIAIGEASTAYLRSRVAVKEIMDYAPNAKFIVGLRNPLEMALSWHAQSVFECYEDVKDFSRAWNLQGERRRGLQIPRLCRDSSGLQYGEVCRLGEQVERLLSLVPRERVFFYTLDNMKQSPETVWSDVCRFLGVSADVREGFPTHNERQDVPIAIRLAGRIYGDVKRMLGLSRFETGILRKLKFRKSTAEALNADFIFELEDYFRSDVKLLEELTGVRVMNAQLWE